MDEKYKIHIVEILYNKSIPELTKIVSKAINLIDSDKIRFFKDSGINNMYLSRKRIQQSGKDVSFEISLDYISPNYIIMSKYGIVFNIWNQNVYFQEFTEDNYKQFLL